MRLPYFTLCLLLGSCASAPRPPTVDDSTRRPVNAASAVGLQVCQAELQNTRISVAETRTAEQRATSTAIRLASAQSALIAQTRDCGAAHNTLYTVLFGFGDARMALTDEESKRLLAGARSSPLILLRGRTDGTSEAPAEARVARLRAEGVRDWLIRSGIDASRIRTTWQPIGDHAADNHAETGRRLNRRVEIELYRALPRPRALSEAADA